ncbi:MAG: cobalamin biosynthesis protein [Pseudobutyrivibrio sp.]|nr:cobalamin biosynthesis protein [Pseudobutyrivibrio sp.]
MVENFLIRIAYFTEKGKEVYSKLEAGLQNAVFEVKSEEIALKDFAKDSFEKHIPLVFVGATGIAVRSIAPFIASKLSDIPVIVIDELGLNVIPILSGHYGMGNSLAKSLAKVLGATPIITTATDIEKVYAIDSFAARNSFRILNKAMIKNVSMKLLSGDKVYYKNSIETLSFADNEPANIEEAKGKNWDIIFSEDESLKENALIIAPKTLVVGMGCKRGKTFEALLEFLLEDYTLEELKNNLYAICSIDKKADELGLLRLAAYLHCKFITFSAEELEAVSGDFSESEFVKEKVGVSNVSERAAVCIGATLKTKKQAMDGMTKAYAIRDLRSIKWQE